MGILGAENLSPSLAVSATGGEEMGSVSDDNRLGSMI